MIELTSPDKVMWPAAGFTKRAMADYYMAIAPALLPHLSGRPLSMGRWPDGVYGHGFIQNECRGSPEWMRTAPLTLQTGEVRNYCVVDDERSLMWVVDQGTIELHPYLARAGDPDRPVALAFDLDPHRPRSFSDCCLVALRLRELLVTGGHYAFAKTSGGDGLHVFVPLAGSGMSFDESRDFARRVATAITAELPQLVSDATRPADRDGRVYIDWMQNSPRRSTIAPYSLRAAEVPVVSTPVSWDEVEAVVFEGGERRLVFGPDDVLARFARDGDLFAQVA